MPAFADPTPVQSASPRRRSSLPLAVEVEEWSTHNDGRKPGQAPGGSRRVRFPYLCSVHTPRTLLLSANYLPEATGTAPYVAALASGLRSRQHDVHVLTTHPHYPNWRVATGYGQWVKRGRVGGVNVTRLRHYVPRRPTPVLRALSEMSFGLRLVGARWGRPTAIVAVSPAMISVALARARSLVTHRRTPFVAWVQDLYGVGLDETGQGRLRGAQLVTALEGWLFRSSSVVVVIHDRFADRIHDNFRVPRERIMVVPNWTHLQPFPAPDIRRVRREYGWADDEVIVLHGGNMGIKQGLHHVIDAARLARTRGDSVRFVLVGSGSQRDELGHLAEAEPANIQFIVPLDERSFTDILQAADVLLVHELPGVGEMAVPSKLTSYFAAGRPVLAATDPTGAAATEIMRAAAGVVVPAGDPAALVDGAIAIVADPDRSAQFGANGRHYRETVLDEATAVDRFDSLLRDLTGADRPGPIDHIPDGKPS